MKYVDILHRKNFLENLQNFVVLLKEPVKHITVGKNSEEQN